MRKELAKIESNKTGQKIQRNSQKDKNGVIGGLVLDGILVDFIGAIFIKMYTKNIEATVKFHAKFAESNNLLLANLIV